MSTSHYEPGKMRLLQQQERMIHKQVGNRILEFLIQCVNSLSSVCHQSETKVKLSIYLVYSLKVYLQILFNIRIYQSCQIGIASNMPGNMWIQYVQ